MANFHPALYVWLFENWEDQPQKARHLADYLSLSAPSETLDYPAGAKFYQQEIGNFRSFVCRSSDSRSYPEGFYPLAIESMARLGKSMQEILQIREQH